MKKTLIVLLLCTLSISLNFKTPIYQVISAHPHDVKDFFPFIKTVKKEGRLWLVEIQKDMPKDLMSHFKKVDSNQVKHYFMPVEKSLTTIPMIEDLIKKIDTKLIRQDIEDLAAFKTRAVGTRENQNAVQKVQDSLIQLGYEVNQICFKAGACSLIADKPSSLKKSQVIMLMAHIDSVGKDFAGADDNASGTAVLLEIARVLRDYDNNYHLRFFVTNGEESGLLGAEHYADQLRQNGQISKIKMAINMDMVGYNSNGMVELETDSEFESMAQNFAQIASTYTTLKSKITIGAWGSDHVPFIKSGVPTLLTIEDWSTKTPCYHQKCDKPETLNYGYATEIAKLNLAAIVLEDLK